MVAILLRVYIAFQGGQFFLQDEVRVHRATTFVQRLYRGHLREAAAVFFEGAHPGYILMAAPGAVAQQVFSEGTFGVRLELA